jgi:hypothetical protein
MKISELIKILETELKTHGDLPVLVPVLDDPEALDEPMDVAVLDGDDPNLDYSQPGGHPTGRYLYIGGQD